MKHLYMSYNNEGFQAALSYGHDFEESHSIADQVQILCDHGNFDLTAGHCKSFQLYSDDGSLILNVEILKAA